MATYTGKQSLLDEALGDFKDFGFELVEPDDHLLELWFKDKRIAVYNQPMATFEIIREGCHNFLVNTSDPATIAKKLEQDYRDTYGEELKRNGQTSYLQQDFLEASLAMVRML